MPDICATTESSNVCLICRQYSLAARRCTQHSCSTEPFDTCSSFSEGAIVADFAESKAQWTQPKRDRLANGEMIGGFAGPERSFPIAAPEDVARAWELSEHSSTPEKVRHNVVQIAAWHEWMEALPPDAVEWAGGMILDFATAGRYVYWRGFKIGIEHEVGSERFGKPMKVAYGFFCNHRGEDGEALDVYLGPHLSSDRIFRIFQPRVDTSDEKLQLVRDGLNNPVLDEYKYMVFFETPEQAERAFKRHMPSVFFGGIEEVSVAAIMDCCTSNHAEPIVLNDDGDMSDAAFDKLLNSDAAIARAATAWQAVAPRSFRGILDAGTEPG